MSEIFVTYCTMWDMKVIIWYFPSGLNNCCSNARWTIVPATWSSVMSTWILLYWQVLSWKLIFDFMLNRWVFFHQRCAWWRFHAWLCQFCSILLTFFRFCVYFGFPITVTYCTMWNTKVIILYVPSELSNCGANPWWTTVPATWSSVLSTYIVLYWQLFSWKLIFDYIDFYNFDYKFHDVDE